MFELHPRLAGDTFLVGSFPLSLLLLMNDASYPWFILVPRREGITEIYQLPAEDRAQLMEESSLLSAKLAGHFGAKKMNVAALGNMVPQLHLHHIVRYETDPAWPAPVWGKIPSRPYGSEERAQLVEGLKSILPPPFVFSS